jgi:hypothetical protein
MEVFENKTLRTYLCTCCLFSNSVSISGDIVTNEWVILNNELKAIRKEVAVT